MSHSVLQWHDFILQWPYQYMDAACRLKAGSMAIILLSASIISCLLIFLIYNRIKVFLIRRQKALLTKHYSNLLAMLVSENITPEKTDKIISRVKTHLEKRYVFLPFNKRFLRKSIMHVHSNMRGSFNNMLVQLYRALKLQRNVLQDLRSWNYTKKSEAATEAGILGITEALPALLKYTNHPNNQLRISAQIATVLLSSNPFIFLDELDHALTPWHQLKLEEAARKIEMDKLPLFSFWYKSPN
jgi:hypothetical protein